jgi:hypothetical protein
MRRPRSNKSYRRIAAILHPKRLNARINTSTAIEASAGLQPVSDFGRPSVS